MTVAGDYARQYAAEDVRAEWLARRAYTHAMAVVGSRIFAYWLAHEVSGMSWAGVGRVLGRDHSTVLRGRAADPTLVRFL